MKVNVKSEKALSSIGLDAWRDIFLETVEGEDNIIAVSAMGFNDNTFIPVKESKGDDAVFAINFCLINESAETGLETNEIDLSLTLEENFYDKDGNLLNAEVFINEDLELETKFYYEVGNFLKTKEEKKVYSSPYVAK